MQYIDIDKHALKTNAAKVYSRITILDTGDVFTEDDHISSWTYEDYRYVPDTGFIGQFVERILDGEFMDLPLDLNLDGATIKLELGIQSSKTTEPNFYDYGNFIITETKYSDTSGNTSFKSADYTKLFNDVYNDTIKYPCTALQLADNICSQVGVPLNMTGVVYTYCVEEPTVDGENIINHNLNVGDYNILINDEYYNFSINDELKPNDTITLIKEEDIVRLIVKTVRLNDDNEYEINRLNTSYEIGSNPIGTTLTCGMSNYMDFENNDYVIFGNYFDDNVTYRDVMKSIGQLAYSWVRINENNKLCIDFSVKDKSEIDEFDTLTTDEYYTSKATNSVIKPINKVGIGLSSVEGETIYATSDDYSVDTESFIYIMDNPLTYTETLRRIAINGCERLYGLTYTPIEINTIGHPWFDANTLIKLTNVDGMDIYTYTFDRKIEYRGYIDEVISSETLSSKSQNHEYKSSQIDRIKQTTITVDKMNGKITSLATGYDEVSGRLSRTEQDIKKIQSIFEIQGGINLIKNSAFLLTDEVWEFEALDENDTYHTELGKSYSSEPSIISHSELKFKNVKVNSVNEFNNIQITSPLETHTLSFKYKLEANTIATLRLINKDTDATIWSNEYNVKKTTITSEKIENIVPNCTNLMLEIETTSTNSGYFYIYDLMLNVGDKQDWSPASDEIISTCIRLSQLGITIYAKGSDFATLMSSNEFAVYKATYDGDNISLGERITNFDDKGIQTGDIEADSLSTGNYVMDERTWGNIEHHIEYFKEGR